MNVSRAGGCFRVYVHSFTKNPAPSIKKRKKKSKEKQEINYERPINHPRVLWKWIS